MKRSDPTPRPRAGAVRCAIYTRKSSEEGLEQEFNSLHAQREACEAYARSQRHEGWVVLPTSYDDGGLSGGTMDRPALQRLLADIDLGRIDTVVVYKVDRLTRSLADFAKIVEIFDARGVAFVSITQQFNTTTSMGRLTLNVLLSFAQFEREVTGERIRDKIAASKQRGMWMGGNLPLGYDVREHKLIINEAEAEQVRHIFQRYVALRSVRLLRDDLAEAGITSKCWTASTGRRCGGKPISRGALYAMLQSRIYIGEISHKGQSYRGQHDALVNATLWEAAQTTLASSMGGRRAGRLCKAPSLLSGLLFDAEGQPMRPTHAVKGGKRYYYYVSRALIVGTRHQAPAAIRYPAAELDHTVGRLLCGWLDDPRAVLEGCETTASDAAAKGMLLERCRALAVSWPGLSAQRQREIVIALVDRVDVASASVGVRLMPGQLGRALDGPEGAAGPGSGGIRSDEQVVALTLPVRLQRIEKSGRLLVTEGGSGGRQHNDALIRLLARAHQFRAALVGGNTVAAVAASAGISVRHTLWTLRLAWLAPDITQAILHGRQPASLTADKLARLARLPNEWSAQRALLGFEPTNRA